MTSMKSYTPAILSVSILAIVMSGSAFAQTAPAGEAAPAAADAGGDGADIIVTGQKVKRSLQETPASVGVTTSEDIQQRNLISVYDALEQTANVAVPANKQTFAIRGIDAFNVSGAGDGALASVYLDGAVLPRRAVQSGPLELFDIEQIEIYRGPQSTLQGRNALAGAVIIRTTDPSYEWSGRFHAQATDKDNGRRIAGALGGPIVPDQIAFRVSGELARSDGFVYGVTIKDDFDKRRSETGRAKLLFTPTALPGLRIVAGYMHDRHKRGDSYVEFDAPYSAFQRRNAFNDPTSDVTTTDLGTLNASYEISKALTINAVTTYSKTHWVSSYDQDFTEQAIGFVTNDEPIKTFTQEVRLNFDTGRLQGLVGGYYANEDASKTTGSGTQRILFSAVGLDRQLVAPPPAGFGLSQAVANFAMDLYPNRAVVIGTNIDYPLTTQNKALFGDASWEFVDGLKLNAGFRWDHERQKRGLNQVVTLLTTLPSPTSVPAALQPLIAGINAQVQALVAAANNVEPVRPSKYKAFLPKGGLTWQVNRDLAVSGTVQRGYRSGGSGTNSARARYFTYDPEYIWNYEFAVRSEWFDRKLTLNANAFLIDWTDQQVRVNLTPGNAYDSETVNAGKSRLWGFELEARARPARGLTLNAGVGYTRTKFLEFTVNSGAQIFVADGNEFANAPRWTVNGGVTWQGDNGILVNANANWRTAAYMDQLVQATREVDARTLVNGRIGWQGEHLGAFVFASNIFNARYVSSYFTSSGARKGIVGDPRVIGISLEGRF